MRTTVVFLFLSSFLVVASPVLGGEAAEGRKWIHTDGILRVFEDHNLRGRERAVPYYYLMKLDVHFGLQFRKPRDANAVGDPDRDLSLLPTCYHHPRSPVGIVMNTLKAGKTSPPFAVVGMHIGAMAAYAKPGQRVDFFEYDPKIIALSVPKKGEPYFTYLADAKKRGAQVRVFPGQARELLAKKAPSDFYQVIVVEMCLRERLEDACVELMTKEGMSLLRDKLTDNGILCYHISNRYLDMVPVLTDVTNDLGLAVRRGQDKAPDSYLDKQEHFQSDWIMVARKQETLDQLQPPADYEELVEKASAKVNNLQYYFEGSYWNTPRPTGKYVWSDKSPHRLEGLIYADPGIYHLASVSSAMMMKMLYAAKEELSPGTFEDLLTLKNEFTSNFFSLARIVGIQRAQAGLTVEDLQKGWPERK